MAVRLADLAMQAGAELVGDGSPQITGVAPLSRAGPSELGFIADPRYLKDLPHTRAGAVILAREHQACCPTAALVTDNPYLSYARAVALLHPEPPVEPGIHPSAVVSPKAHIDPSAAIGAQVVIEANARIGAHVVIGPACLIGTDCEVGATSRLMARVTLCRGTQLGQAVIIHPGVVIGADGFGLAHDGGRWIKIPQLGRVRIGDQVEIGANTTIDRGTLEDTVIEEGVKLDNQIQIAHNVFIGAHTAIAGCVGIAGSARIGRHCTIGGASGIQGHIELADGVQITAMVKVTKSILKPGVYSSGTPLELHAKWRKNARWLRRLDELAQRVVALEDKLRDHLPGRKNA